MQGNPPRSVVERFAEIGPQEFAAEIDRRWKATETVKQTIVRLVEDEQLSPLEGLGLLACTTGQVYAYSQFHGQSQPVDMIAALQPAFSR